MAKSAWIGLDGRLSWIKNDAVYNRFMDITTRLRTYWLDDSRQGLRDAFNASVWAYRCIMLKAQATASLPLTFWAGDRELLPSHPLPRLVGRGNSRLLYQTKIHEQIWGNAYWFLWRGPRGLDITPLNPLGMEVERNEYGVVGFRQMLTTATSNYYMPEQIVYFHLYNADDDLFGQSPTTRLLTSIAAEVSLAGFQQVFFENDATPAGLLTTEQAVQDADAERLTARWRQMFKGTQNSGKTAFLDRGTQYQTVTPPLKDLAMPEVEHGIMRRIAAVYGVPMTIAGMDNAANYAVAQEQRKSFYTETILPEADLLLDTINNELCPVFGDNVRVEVDTSKIEALQEERLQRTQRVAQLYQAGVMSLNEAREMEGLQPLPVDYLINTNATPRAQIEAGEVAAPVPSLFPPSFSMPLAARSLWLDDLQKWQTKLKRRGVKAYTPDYLPPAMAAFVRMELDAGNLDAIKNAIVAIKQMDDNNELATPEEFEAYWRNIGELYDGLKQAVSDAWRDFTPALLAALRGDGNLAPVLDSIDDSIKRCIEEQAQKIALAGAARGNDLLNDRRLSADFIKDVSLDIVWDVINSNAAAWARQFAERQVDMIGATTRRDVNQVAADWINSGKPLSQLADWLEGVLPPEAVPVGVSDEKLKWLTSDARAALIAQTVATQSYHEGVSERWKQAGVTRVRFRTQNDPLVCDTCRSLNNQIGELGGGWFSAKTNTTVTIPVHPGCRCFASPVVEE